MKSEVVIKQSTISTLIIGIFFFIAILLGGSTLYMSSSIKAEQTAEKRRTEFKQLGIDLAEASDYLTDEARKYAVTTDIEHLYKYWEEINDTRTRDYVISRLQELNSPDEELALLAEAKKNSDALVDTERHSMRLVLEAVGQSESSMVPEVASFKLTGEDSSLSRGEKLAKARDIMFNNKYDNSKRTIMSPIAEFQEIMNSRLEAELEAARRGTSGATAIQIVLAIVIICAIAVLIWILFAQITYPIRNYTGMLHEFSFENENFSLAPEGTQELRMLAGTFNELYASFREELVKRKMAEETMKAAKDEAELANNAKSEFLANMSHEIRTPLNTIIGYQYLLQSTVLRLKQKEYSQKIGIAAKNLLGIINEILDFSKIEAGRMTLENVDFDLHAAIGELCQMVGIEAERKGLGLGCHIGCDVPQYITGDVTRLKQVILNLLANGVKFTHTGRLDIWVNMLKEAQDKVLLCFTVADTGIGISNEQKDKLFQVFTQGDASTSRKYGGTGLGLAICKRIVRLMEGEIYVESEEGQGSVFKFTVKMKRAEGIPEAKDEDSLESVKGKFAGKRVLIVEDNVINLEMTREILEIMGFETHTASSGAEAVSMAGQGMHHAILMDIRMPGMDGYEAARRIKGMEGLRQTPIIALSADAVEGVAEKAKAAGMEGYLTKPLNPSALAFALGEIICRSGGIGEGQACVKMPGEAGCEGRIDFRDGISRLGGSREKYAEILTQFVARHSQDAQRLKAFMEKGKTADAGRLVHTLKGVAGSIGARPLMAILAELEKAIMEHEKGKAESLTNAFGLALREVCACAEEFVKNYSDMPVRREQTHDREYREVIIRLYELLKEGDPEARGFFDTHMGLLEENMEATMLGELREEIWNYGFEDAAARLGKLVKEHPSIAKALHGQLEREA
ncbi:Hpt sensor hybrid histidine kinase [Anaerobacterium chartisolvens]|uniref:Circadian input-output histidine kinase CikA n=1 Tax=Anaerobacterium chartisolvens TaxID=1297424 RepID=A0A369AZC6_9FIRM|nr:hybrid sensor histidine kinase/response regulator [Anaerobacterium chartisolvens]RCX13536.1 Hpt sensor hybrid histidine kinase [Anaerobacterium chartisolvens]